MELIRREKNPTGKYSVQLIIDVNRKLSIVRRIVNGVSIPQPKAYFNRFDWKKKKNDKACFKEKKLVATTPLKTEHRFNEKKKKKKKNK